MRDLPLNFRANARSTNIKVAVPELKQLRSAARTITRVYSVNSIYSVYLIPSLRIPRNAVIINAAAPQIPDEYWTALLIFEIIPKEINRSIAERTEGF